MTSQDPARTMSEPDLAVLAVIAERDPDELREHLRRRPWALNELMASPRARSIVIDGDPDPSSLDGQPMVVSPFLLFGVLAQAAADELHDRSHVLDWSGRALRIPVFDVEPLLEFVEDPARLLFVANLLARFATPQPVAVPPDGLDLGDLARWTDAVEPQDRPRVLRRLGDLALFLLGVYPDRTAPMVVAPDDAGTWGRTLGMTGDEVLELTTTGSPAPGLDLLEWLGPRWYGAAVTEAAAEQSAAEVPPVVLDVAQRFRSARRFLNHLADRYLHPTEVTLGVVL